MLPEAELRLDRASAPGLRSSNADREEVVEALHQVEDPELGMDIVELGLLGDVEVDGAKVKVTYTLTSMACPVGPMIQEDIDRVVGEVPGVEEVEAELTFDPPVDPRPYVRGREVHSRLLAADQISATPAWSSMKPKNAPIATQTST